MERIKLYQGDITLSPEHDHSLTADWSLFDHFSFTSLFVRVGAHYTRDKVSISQTVNRDLTKTIRPVNVPDDAYAFWYINFSTPIRALGLKINAVSHESWHRGISIINGEDNTENSLMHRIDLNVENRMKQGYHIRMGGSVTVNDTKYSVAKDMNNVYFNTSYYADAWYNPFEWLDLDAEAHIVNYNSQSFKESVSVPLIQAGVSFHFLKGKRATLSLRGYDLLNKYSSFERVSDINVLMEVRRNTIGRYVMLSLRLRTGRVE
jgi:hypothetical protein